MKFNSKVIYAIPGAQLNKLVTVAFQLYKEERLDGDAQRNLAQLIYEGILPSCFELDQN